MILVDSSAWIEFYRPSGDQRVASTVAKVIEEDMVCTNGIFRAFHWLKFGHNDFDLASKMGFDLRRGGVTVPATDLIIAASAIHADATVYHLDSHFDQIAKNARLKAVHLKKSGS